MEETTKYCGYREYKEKLDSELQKAAEGFVKIGYLLKIARDTDILKESGYASVNEFAKAEYSIDKTQVSRFISINDRFSEGGYSELLKIQFRGFGYAKLAIMLQLPDEINEELSPDFSKAEVQAIKEEADAEKKISDIELILEGVNEVQSVLDDNLHKVIHQLGHDNPELYISLHTIKKAQEPETEIRGLHEILAPAGESIYSIRIQGTGRLMLSLKDMDKDVTLTNVRSGEKECYTWLDVAHAVQQVLDPEKGPEESWAAVYGEVFPKQEKPEVAPVQQQEKKPVPKKPVRVTRAAEKKPVSDKECLRQEKAVDDTAAGKMEETIVPEEERRKEPVSEDVHQDSGRQEETGEETVIYRLKEETEAYLEEVKRALDANEYLRARTETKHLLETINEIMEAMEQRPIPGQEQMELKGA